MKPLKAEDIRIQTEILTAIGHLPGVVSCRAITIPHDPYLQVLFATLDPILMHSTKGLLVQTLKDHAMPVFTNEHQWLFANVMHHLFSVDSQGIHRMIITATQSQSPVSSQLKQVPFPLIKLDNQPINLVFGFLESIFYGQRALYSGNHLSAQSAMAVALEAMKGLMGIHYQGQAQDRLWEGEPTWAQLSMYLSSDLKALFEATFGDMVPQVLASHYIQLINVVLHIIEAMAPSEIEGMPILGLVKAREWLEQAFVFKSAYIESPQWRAPFNQLSKEVFGLDFEPWYQQGGWDSRYEPFTFYVGAKAVANVSITKVNLKVDDVEVKGIQVGTVMTDPSYRRLGLSKALFERIFVAYPPTDYLYFLAADEAAVPLYEQCGFVPWSSHRFTVDLPETDLTRVNPAIDRAATLSPPGEWVEAASLSLFEKLHQASEPVSKRLCALDDALVLKFYGVMGLLSSLYKLEEGVYALMTADAETAHLSVYRFFIPRGQRYDLALFIDLASTCGFKKLEFLYDPQSDGSSCFDVVPDAGGWMVHSGFGLSFPEGSCFPKISQT